MVRAIIALFMLAISSPVFGQEGLTKSQSAIFRSVMAVDGSITKEAHQSFWADVPRDANGQWDRVSLWLVESLKLGQAYQKALWQSALISYDQSEVIRTESLKSSETAFMNHFFVSSPFEKGSRGYETFVEAGTKQLKISTENAQRLLNAAANHSDFVSVNGETVKLDESLIRTVLSGLEASFKRLQLLVNPVWTGP